MRTSEHYRDELDKLNEYFGGKGTLQWKEVIEYTGRGYRWCNAHIKLDHRNVTTVQLAKALAKL